MSAMSDLDLQLREAGINPESVTLEEAIDILRTIEVAEDLDEDCDNCEIPEMGIITYTQFSDREYEVIHCGHPCRVEMPQYIADELLGLEETMEDRYE